MPSRAFTLTVPTDTPFRDLTATALRTYLDREDPDAIEAVTTRVTEAVVRLAAHGATLEMAVTGDLEQLSVTLSCGGHEESLRWPAESLS
jgi:hypothetical protein